MNIEKNQAARMAVEKIQNNSVVGLGSGSTAAIFIRLLAEKVKKEHMNIVCVATSIKSGELGSSLGLKVVDIDDVSSIDVTVDGADEVDYDLNGIKGGGAALLFEKIVASKSKYNIWIIDSSKFHKKLGNFKLPVEVIKFGSQRIFDCLQEMGLNPTYRLNDDSTRLLTDSSNYIIDIDIQHVSDLNSLSNALENLTGVVEHGLFINICNELLIGGLKKDIKKSELDDRLVLN
ncbi:ribose-5-phosphate isomerase RpiA [Apilactobacillus xinyiensis]|uniref:ribose-5-phosphate isomerase RpiA n=1 Tax=Apilactobacillus xinyiensis TaxID=2841032 RepID=UPI002010B7C5|nr:ribose-5-phosphate isomerase RpiA [Apilactobacillus xinyiensis]MCL0330204.1 ribose-5-phosphate isomerase RpiA [Apilactobacillus xinyiensis]